MRKWIAHWDIWLETVLAAIILMGVNLIFANLGPIWRELLQFMAYIRPFFIGMAIAYLLNGPSSCLQRKFNKLGIPFAKGLSVLLAYLFALLIVGLMLVVILPMLILNIWDFMVQVPVYTDWLLENIVQNHEIIMFLSNMLLGLLGNLESMQELVSQVGSGLSFLGDYARMMTSGIFDVFLGIVISIYMLLYKETLFSGLDQVGRLLFKPAVYRNVLYYMAQSHLIFGKFVACKLLAGFILGTLSGVVLSLLGVRYAMMLGLIIGVSNLIPYLGGIFSFIVTVTISWLTGGNMMALLSGVFLILLQQVDDTIIQPRLVGGALNLNPVLIILAITIGNAYFGVLGMFLSVPMAAVIKVLVERIMEKAK